MLAFDTPVVRFCSALDTVPTEDSAAVDVGVHLATPKRSGYFESC